MRENQRNTRTYADNTSAALQKGNDNNAESTLKTGQDDAASQRTDPKNAGSEGMMYLDIIPRFAL